MRSSNMVESHIVDPKTNTPVKMHFIQLSPKGKSKRDLRYEEQSRKIQTQNSQSIIDSHNNYKENNPLNFQIVNIPIRTEKPFEKIPSFKNEQVIVRRPKIGSDLSEGKSKRKKITVTKLFNEYPQEQVGHPSAFSYHHQQHVANQQF